MYLCKLTPDNLSQKLGKKIDIASVNELKLDSMGIIEVSSFSRLKALEDLDLSQNRLQLLRHIKGLYDSPALKKLNLTGNPVTKVNGYRLHIIANIPSLEVLDGKPITSQEREQSKLPIVKDPLANANDNEESDEEEVVEQPPKKVAEPVKPVAATTSAAPTPTPTPAPTPAPAVEQARPTLATPVSELPPASATTAAAPTVERITKQVKENLFVAEDDLFSSAAPKKKPLSFESDSLDESLFGADDDLNKFEKKKPQPKAASKLIIEDSDDLFASSTTSSKSSKVDLDDDLFKDFGEEKGGLSSEFDMSSYLDSRKDRKKGGLFD
ncbi:hypothetical protein SAMD00019534_008440 [Acytostelium subglobosum LB1]|uniref:hypothetical protein n=1 Tax=Acytostelium subglobosum LB1 TaxID=1410327 RepID=UPI000644A541|nr:hypothetical protein SAMD00019534_008440 [Acytostelium subglobosum LB1]GAM17669.1 hypothetical protein SAMD00019534_008440 [Acytostelium subglobosum LB1]|eukprot:XP_012758265.1 hypothetical protein SAMD00019534_008440 [Acytostelium subglobosum LB1]